MVEVRRRGTARICLPRWLQMGFDVGCYQVKIGQNMMMMNDGGKVAVHPYWCRRQSVSDHRPNSWFIYLDEGEDRPYLVT